MTPMADWFKFYNDGLDEPRFQYAISENPSVVGTWLLILSEASKKRSDRVSWRDQDFELFGYARKINVSVPVLNECINILCRIGYIAKDECCIVIPGWASRQSDYAKGLNKGYYKKTSKTLASNSEVSTIRREEKRVEEKRDTERVVAPLRVSRVEKSKSQLRAEKLLGKRPDTAYDKSEQAAWKTAESVVEATADEDWTLLEAFYAAPQPETYSRKNYATLLNNWNGEVEKAKNWKKNKETHGKYQNTAKHHPQRIDRSIGTANEGTANQYANLGNVGFV